MAIEERRFGMHQNLLYSVILRQAGTVQKALLEAVMNAIDAGATRCEIELETDRFSVLDDGRGFQSKEEIKHFFEMFGTPHEEGDAVFGTFRMGRGQLMAFGRNTWRSRHFEMRVDIKARGLDYELEEHAEDHDGTRIEVALYDPILPSDLERTKAELRRFVAWAQIPVLLNGERISTHPKDGKWSHEDEHAYYALSSERSQLMIYNLGVLVTSAWSGRFGMGGTVVSKRQLEVNFARNDVQSSCPVFKPIAAYIKREAQGGVAKKTRLTDAERDMLVRDFLAGDLSVGGAAKLRALTDVTGRSWPIAKLMQLPIKFSNRLVVGERGDQMVETAQRRGIAFSVDEATLERFGVSDGAALMHRIADSATRIAQATERSADYSAHYNLGQIGTAIARGVEVVEREDLKAFVSDDHIALLDTEMTADFKVLLAAIDRGFYRMIQMLNAAGYEDRRFEMRQIRLGRSQTALAWTDGQKVIWIDVEHARLLRRGMSGAYQIASTLLHEMLHEGPDTGTHQHDFAFYQAYHDLSGVDTDPLGAAAERMVSMMISRLTQHKRKISKSLLSRDDADAALDALRADIDAREDADID